MNSLRDSGILYNGKQHPNATKFNLGFGQNLPRLLHVINVVALGVASFADFYLFQTSLAILVGTSF